VLSKDGAGLLQRVRLDKLELGQFHLIPPALLLPQDICLGLPTPWRRSVDKNRTDPPKAPSEFPINNALENQFLWREAKELPIGYSFRTFFNSSVNAGTIWNRSPTIA